MIGVHLTCIKFDCLCTILKMIYDIENIKSILFKETEHLIYDDQFSVQEELRVHEQSHLKTSLQPEVEQHNLVLPLTLSVDIASQLQQFLIHNEPALRHVPPSLSLAKSSPISVGDSEPNESDDRFAELASRHLYWPILVFLVLHFSLCS